MKSLVVLVFKELKSEPTAWDSIEFGEIEINPVTSYYYMKEHFGVSSDLYLNLPCPVLCDSGKLLGDNVTGKDSNNKKYNEKGEVIEAWQYDDSGFMNGFNAIWLGAQSWSTAHDYYLEDSKNQYRPFGSSTEWTIIPFFILGTSGGIYGSIAKPIKGTIDYINNKLRGNNK